MAKQAKSATDELNVALAGMQNALSFARNSIDEADPAMSVLKQGEKYCEDAFSALLTIRFHASHI